ncbi:MAG: carboxypeptidase regulatory-like domain-containing protein [Bacteroidetes bacterium]|nr:carboxypeptidase regulatory-like domain-containing protein [Bacteroidota bacterium]
MKKSVIFCGIISLLFFTNYGIAQVKSNSEIKTGTVSPKNDAVTKTNSKLKIDGGMPNRISMNVTVPKQTQGATFGEKVNAGLQATGGALSQGTSVTISGNIRWDKIEFPNTVNTVSTVGNLAGAGGGAAAASYAATGRVGNDTNDTASGISTEFYAREAGSGMATGRRQYQPIYISRMNENCEDCLVILKKSETSYNWDIKKNEKARAVNPIYQENEQKGENPIYNKKIADNKDNDCDGLAGIYITLINTETGEIVSKAISGKCGEFTFPNITIGTYTLQLNGNFIAKKGYDFYMAKETDFKGNIKQNKENVKLVLMKNDEVTAENKIIKTKTKSNQSNDKVGRNEPEIVIVNMDNSYGDVDNDGSVDLLIGGALPGGSVISSALNARPGNPIGGLSIKGGKNPGGQLVSKQTNEQGDFEFLNLEPGDYKFILEQTVFINSEVQIQLISKTKHDTVKNSINNIR